MVVCASSGAGHSLLCEGIDDALVPYWGQLPCWLPVSVGQQGASSTGALAESAHRTRAGLEPLEPVIPSRAAVLAAGPGQAWAPAGEQALWEEGLAADGGPSSADREGDVVSSTA